MNFNALHFQKLIQAISLTLIHSLWQGLIAAVLAGMILMLTKKAKPALRYNLLATLLFAFMLASAYTFMSLLFAEKGLAGDRLSGLTSVQSAEPEIVSVSESISFIGNGDHAWISIIMDFCSSHAQLIVAVWFIVFAFKSVQATAGFLYLQKIKKERIHPVRESWRHRIEVLAGRLKISQAIQVVESENVLVPMVIGFIKPMVIIPFGIFMNLPETQIEAIILHELAHIKRRDYLVNLIQIFCENVFFFNPALLWLSSLVKEEREHCCDDLAISVMENKTSFVHALVSFQEYNVKGSAFEVAFSKKRNHLLDRIKRIIYNNNKPLNAMEKLFVTFSLLTAVALSAAIPQDSPQPPKTHPSKVVQTAPKMAGRPEAITAAIPDTLPKKKKEAKAETAVTEEVEIDSNLDVQTTENNNLNINGEGINTYSITSNGKHYDLVTIGAEMKILRIDGKEIPEEEFDNYKKEVEEVKTKIKQAHEEAEVRKREAEQHRAEAEVRRKQADIVRLAANEDRLKAEAMRERADERRAEAELRRAKAEDERGRFEGMQDNIINDLKESGVIKTEVGLMYKFNQDELVVNGVKQPAALHQKLKAKYMKGKDFEMLYNNGSKSNVSVPGSDSNN